MGILDAPFSNLAQALCDRLGGSAVLTQTLFQYDKLSGNKTTSIRSWNVSCSPEYPTETGQYPDTSVRKGDYRIVVPSKNLQGFSPPAGPDLHMTFKRGSDIATIVAIEPINAGDLVVAWILHCKR